MVHQVLFKTSKSIWSQIYDHFIVIQSMRV